VAQLSKREKADAREIFALGGACTDCGAIHQRACPRVKRQVWLRTGAGDGQRTEVEYWPPGWDQFQEGLIWPEDAYDPDDDAEAADG
jgi:hypothetical protein